MGKTHIAFTVQLFEKILMDLPCHIVDIKDISKFKSECLSQSISLMFGLHHR